MTSMILIDSGLNVTGKFESNYVGGIAITQNKETGEFIYEGDIDDQNGHGTYCAEIILELCPNISFHVIKIVNDAGFSSSGLLEKALEICLKSEIQIICISLSVIGKEQSETVTDLLGRLRKMEKIICISVENGKENSFPANLPTVIGVRGRIYYNLSFFTYNREENMACFDSTPVLLKNKEGKYIFFRGNSKANAVCAGYIASLIENIRKNSMKINFIERYLSDNAGLEMTQTTEDMDQYLEKITKKDSQDFRKLVYGFNGYKLEENLLYVTPVLSKKTGINMNNIMDFLETVEQEMKVSINYSKLSYCDVYYIGNFLNYIRGLRE